MMPHIHKVKSMVHKLIYPTYNMISKNYVIYFKLAHARFTYVYIYIYKSTLSGQEKRICTVSHIIAI